MAKRKDTARSRSKEAVKKIKNPLTRGWRRAQLLRELAQGEQTMTQLAAKYGVTIGRISQINKEDAERIAAIKEDLENEFAGLWIAQKYNRLAEYQAMAERILDRVGEEIDPDDEQAVQLERLRANVLKSVAEELGHLPSKVQLNVGEQTIRYSIDGINPEDLR